MARKFEDEVDRTMYVWDVFCLFIICVVSTPLIYWVMSLDGLATTQFQFFAVYFLSIVIIWGISRWIYDHLIIRRKK